MSRIFSPLLALLIAAAMLTMGYYVHRSGTPASILLPVYLAILIGCLLSFTAYAKLAKHSSEDGKLPLLLLLSIYAEGAWIGLFVILLNAAVRDTLDYERVVPQSVVFALAAGVMVTILIRGLVLFAGSFGRQRLLSYRVRSMIFRRRR